MRAFVIHDTPNNMGFERYVVRIDNGKPYEDNPPVITTDDPLRLIDSLINFLWEKKDESEAG